MFGVMYQRVILYNKKTRLFDVLRKKILKVE